jgi:hypothetical protein
MFCLFVFHPPICKVLFEFFSATMFDAAWNCRASIAVLHMFGCELDPTDSSNFTPLMWCASNQHVQELQLFLSLNADVTKADFSGSPALQLAMSDDIKQLLLEHEKKSVFICYYVFFKENKTLLAA